MSKKKKKTRKHQPVKKKKSNKKTIITCVCVALAAALLIAGGIIADRLTNIKYVDFVEKGTFKSTSAYDSKGKEVDLYDIYNVRYSNYHGSLTFNEDGTFSLWMTPGPVDGSNDGTFTYNRGENVIKGEYKSGKKINFKIVRDKNGALKHIEAPYEDYTIYFS